MNSILYLENPLVAVTNVRCNINKKQIEPETVFYYFYTDKIKNKMVQKKPMPCDCISSTTKIPSTYSSLTSTKP